MTDKINGDDHLLRCNNCLTYSFHKEPDGEPDSEEYDMQPLDLYCIDCGSVNLSWKRLGDIKFLCGQRIKRVAT